MSTAGLNALTIRMTPLPWWVLLATLLGRAIGVPVHGADGACVHFCRPRASEPVELCKPSEPVLQYDGTHVGARSALGLCLAPCTTAPDEFRARSHLEELQYCPALRHILAKIRGCACEGLNGLRDESSASSFARYKDVIRSAEEELGEFMRKLDGLRARGEEEVDETGSSKVQDRPVGETKARWTLLMDWIRGAYEGDGLQRRNEEGLAITSTEETSSEEDSVDWDLWCMAQCDNGQGGSACKCDIIP